MGCECTKSASKQGQKNSLWKCQNKALSQHQRRGEILQTSTISVVLGEACSSPENILGSSITREDQNVVLIILGENTCYFFPLGWQMLNSMVSGETRQSVWVCADHKWEWWPLARTQHPGGGKGEEKDKTQTVWKYHFWGNKAHPLKTG